MNIKDIKTNPDNPRVIKDDKFKKLVKSIKEFPQMMELRPIIVDEKNIIQGGNMRYKALVELGYKEIPDNWVKQGKELTEEQWKEFVIKDNIGFGEWDYELLANDFNNEDLINWGLDLPKDVGGKIEAEEDDYEIPDEITTDIVLGDLFEIGEHRLMCGDSTDSDCVAKLMGGQKAELLFTSPPYNAGSLMIDGNESTKNKYNEFDDNKTEDEYFKFLTSNIESFIPFVDEIFYNLGLVENNKRVLNRLAYHYNDIFKDIIYWNRPLS